MNANLPDPNVATRDAVRDYLRRTTPGYAILIAAPWGAGKTYMIRDLIRETPGADKPLYVSLFGVADEGGARRAILRAVVGDGAERTERALHLASDLAKKFVGVDLRLGLEDIARLADHPAAIILDDLERSGLAQATLSGLVNDIVEHGGKHVVLLANEEKLWSEGREQKEKIIGLTLPLVAEVEAALPRFLQEIDMDARSFLQGEEELIREVFKRAGHHNLRSLRQVLFDFARVHSQLGEDLRKAEDGMREFLRTYLALALEVKAGELGADDLKRRGGIGDRSKPEFARLREISAKYDWRGIQYGYGNVLPGHLSRRLLLEGAVETAEIREALIASGWFLVPDEDDWQVILWASQRDPDAVASANAALERRFLERDYKEPGVLLQVFNARFHARRIGLDSKSVNNIEQECRSYIDDLAVQGQLLELDPESAGSQDETGFRNLSYPQKGSTGPFADEAAAFWRLHDHLKSARIARFEAGLRPRAKEILTLFRDGKIEEVSALLWRKAKGREGELRHIPVLAHGDAVLIAEAISLHAGHDLSQIGWMFKERYDYYGTGLDREKAWLGALATALSDEAERRRQENPVHAWQLDELVRHSLQPVIDRHQAVEAD